MNLDEAAARVARLEADLAQAKSERDELVLAELRRIRDAPGWRQTRGVSKLARRAGLSRGWVYRLAESAETARAASEG